MRLVDASERSYSQPEEEPQMQPEIIRESQAPPVMEDRPSHAPSAAAGQRRAVFDLTEGEVVITFPESMSPESVSDLQDYLNVFMKKAKREAGVN